MTSKLRWSVPRCALVVVAACSAHDGAPAPPPRVSPERAPAAPTAVTPPGLRLPDEATPLAYDLHLDVDPEREDFTGHVEIRVRLAAPTDHVWLHADELDLSHATYRAGAESGALVLLPALGDQMRAFGFGHVVRAPEVTLAIDYVGHTRHDEEGLFRQQDGEGRWYAFTQAQSVLARRFVPCFDEPRWKTPWHVALTVPAAAVALANMPEQSSRLLPGGRREVAFAETPAMPSYLLAVAVGPFELVDAGVGGKAHVPLRVAALAGQHERVAVVRERLPAVIAAAEEQFGDALPLPKLDLVVVPHLFGAMENPGLVTVDARTLVGDSRDRAFAAHFVRIAAHEVVHQWFGNLVTPLWWDDLWLAESFASWLGDRIAERLDSVGDPDLYFTRARRDALAAEVDPDTHTMHRMITSNSEPDDDFDAIAYEKGASVLTTLDAATAAWQRGVTKLLAEHRGGGMATRDLVAAIGDPDVGATLVDYIDHVGAPVVELELRCAAGTPPALGVHIRADRRAPICIRYAGDHGPVDGGCTFVHGDATLALHTATCPTWVVGNRDAGYYQVAWRSPGPLGPFPPRAQLHPREVLALGDDVAAGLSRGEVGARAAADAVTALAAMDEPHAQLAALAITRELDPLVPDAARPAWGKWLAARFAARLTPRAAIQPEHALDVELRDELAQQVPAAALPIETQREAARALATELGDGKGGPDPALAAFAAPVTGHATFERLTQLARSSRATDAREAALEALGRLGPGELEPTMKFFLTATEVPGPGAWSAFAGYFERAETRAAAWQSVRAHVAEIFSRLSSREVGAVITATGTLCDARSRGEVETQFATRVRDLPEARRELERALAAIDRCIAHRANATEFARGLGKK